MQMGPRAARQLHSSRSDWSGAMDGSRLARILHRNIHRPQACSPRGNMTLKPALITMSLAQALACGAVHAADLGTLDLASGSAGFSNTPVAGSFVDTLTFTLPFPGIANGSLTTVLNGNQDLDFASVA